MKIRKDSSSEFKQYRHYQMCLSGNFYKFIFLINIKYENSLILCRRFTATNLFHHIPHAHAWGYPMSPFHGLSVKELPTTNAAALARAL